jgi:hypothetical protein
MVDKNQYNKEEARARCEAALRGAFNGPPTQLKDIPTKKGESRVQRKKPTKKRASSTAKSGRGTA